MSMPAGRRVGSGWLGWVSDAGPALWSAVGRLTLVPRPDEPGWLTVFGRSDRGTWIGASVRWPVGGRPLPVGCDSAGPDAVAVVGETLGGAASEAAGRVGDGSGPDGRRGVVGRDGDGTDGRVGVMGRDGAGAVPLGATGVDCSAVELPVGASLELSAGTDAGFASGSAAVVCAVLGGSSARTRPPTGALAEAVEAAPTSPASAADEAVRVLDAAASTRAASDPVACAGAVADLLEVAAGAWGRGVETADAVAGSAVDFAATAGAVGRAAAGATGCAGAGAAGRAAAGALGCAGADVAGGPEIGEPPGAAGTGVRLDPRCAGPAAAGKGSGAGAGLAGAALGVAESSVFATATAAPALPESCAADAAPRGSSAGPSTSDG
jgi:hypothetical protein